MPDITMCNSDECTIKEKCYRYKAKPSIRQSYGDFYPIPGNECDFYIPIKEDEKN